MVQFGAVAGAIASSGWASDVTAVATAFVPVIKFGLRDAGDSSTAGVTHDDDGGHLLRDNGWHPLRFDVSFASPHHRGLLTTKFTGVFHVARVFVRANVRARAAQLLAGVPPLRPLTLLVKSLLVRSSGQSAPRDDAMARAGLAALKRPLRRWIVIVRRHADDGLRHEECMQTYQRRRLS